jgi:hypothetical protein
MEDDIISALTLEVKEEVVEKYLYERRLVEEQINYVKELAESTAKLEAELYKRFARIYGFLSENGHIGQFVGVAGLQAPPFEVRFREDSHSKKSLPFIKVWGLSYKAKFKKLLLEAYRRLFKWNEAYREDYENLAAECEAVNRNLKKFEDDFDLLTILNFLKDMDVDFIEKKHFLSDNFTPGEMTSIETTLRFKPVRMEQFGLVSPPSLPNPDKIQKDLNELANCVFGQCSLRIKSLMK